MDYVIFGFGLGASLVLIGWAFREVGSFVRYRTPDSEDVLTAEEMVARMSWARFCGSCGAMIALDGLLLLIATGGVLLFRPSDRTGTITVLAAFAVAIVATLLWTRVFVGRFGTHGILRPRPSAVEQEAEPAPAAEQAPAAPDVAMSSTTAEASPAGQPAAVVAAAAGGPADDEDQADTQPPTTDEHVAEASEPEPSLVAATSPTDESAEPSDTNEPAPLEDVDTDRRESSDAEGTPGDSDTAPSIAAEDKQPDVAASEPAPANVDGAVSTDDESEEAVAEHKVTLEPVVTADTEPNATEVEPEAGPYDRHASATGPETSADEPRVEPANGIPAEDHADEEASHIDESEQNLNGEELSDPPEETDAAPERDEEERAADGTQDRSTEQPAMRHVRRGLGRFIRR